MHKVSENNDINDINDSISYDFVRQLVQCQNRIYSYILTLVPNWSDADDILQDTIEVMWRKYGEQEDIENFTSLGISISRNIVFSYYRNKKQRETSLEQTALENIADFAAELSVENDERIKVLRSCLTKLSNRDMELIRLRYEENMNVKKVAEVSNRSVYGLYKALGRIHDAIMKCVRSGMAMEKYQ